MKLQFISDQHISEAVKFLAGKGHLPFTDADGTPNHRLMGAAWASLHGGYRGNKYEGKNKAAAITKLTSVYKSEKMDTPEESFALDGEFFQESLAKSDSFDSIWCQVMDAIYANIKAGTDMDCDDDGAEDSGRCVSCGCNCGREYGCSCCSECDCEYPKTAWCLDLFADAVVYSMDGGMFQCSYSISGDTVTLGDPIEVETSYTPVDDGNPQESFRVLALATTPFEESAYDAASGKLTMTVITPGLNKSKARFYPKETLIRDYKVFENAKMFADHQTEKASKEQPEGSVNNWVAQINKVWPESDGTIKATAIVIDPPFKAKLDSLNKSGLLHEMGVSIRAIGEASEGEREGVTTNVVESLIAARSVDFVTYAGAGGQIEAMESALQDYEDVDLVTEAELRKRRPDLISLVEKHHQEITMKSLEQQLKESKLQNDTLATANADLTKKFAEAQTAATKLVEDRKAADKTAADQLKESQTNVTKLTESNIELTGKIEEAEKATVKATVANELTKRLNESKLPEISQNRIRKQFAEAIVIDGIKEAIIEELAYVKSLGGKLGTVKNLGASDNGTLRESENVPPTQEKLAEAYVAMGLNEKEAKLAASGSKL